jgi:hypothetical protein
MPELEFAYASTEHNALPPHFRRVFDRHWMVATLRIDDLLKRQSSPDFIWIDFGHRAEPRKAIPIIGALAALQDRSEKPAYILISGEASSSRAQTSLISEIYSRLPKAEDVDVTFQREPNLRNVLARFTALRRAAQKAKTAAVPTPVLRLPNADLRSEGGNLSIKPIADLYDLPVAEIGRLIGRPNRAALIKTPDADSLQEPLRPFADIASFREAANDDTEFRKWLRTPNDSMQGRSPLDCIRAGQVRDVAGFVHGALTGQAT